MKNICLGGNRMRQGTWSEGIDLSPLDAGSDYFIIIWYRPYPEGGIINGTMTIPGIAASGFHSSDNYQISNDLGGAQHFPFRGKPTGMRLSLSVSGSSYIKGQFIVCPGFIENRFS